MIALSKATSNVAGAVNQIINTGFRLDDTTRYENLAQAFADADEAAAAQYLAEFTKDFLSAEIPDQASLATYQNVGSLQWSLVVVVFWRTKFINMFKNAINWIAMQMVERCMNEESLV